MSGMDEWATWGIGNNYSCIDIVRFSTDRVACANYSEGLLVGLCVGIIATLSIGLIFFYIRKKRMTRYNGKRRFKK